MKNALILLFALAACATVAPARLDWMPAAELTAPSAADYPEADAVALLHEEKYTFTLAHGMSTRIDEHAAVAILTEQGFRHANVRVPSFMHMLVQLNARAIAPDGTVQEVEPSSIYEEAARVEGMEFSYRIFTFPNVQVGSVLEYQYSMEVPILLPYFWQLISQDIPVKRYQLDLQGQGPYEYAVKAYHAEQSIETLSGGKGWHVRWGTRDIPARLSEKYAPDIREYEPWWAFRITRIIGPMRVFDEWQDLRTAMRAQARSFYGPQVEQWFKDYGLELVRPAGCDTRCAVEKAWAAINGRVTLSSGAASDEDDEGIEHSAAQVVKRGKGDSRQRALLLRKMLDGAGIDARYALTQPFATGYVDDNFPMPGARSKLLLYLPKQAGLEEALWLDPACDWCAVGQVEDALRDTRAVVLHTSQIESVPVKSAAPASDGDSHDYRVKLDEAGDLTATLTRAWLGQEAHERRLHLRAHTALETQREDEEFVGERLPTGHLDSHSATECKPGEPACTDQLALSVGAYATADKGELIAPLSLLRTRLDEVDFGRVRRLDVTVRRSQVIEETATFEAPPGFEVARMPAARSMTGPGISIQVDAHIDGGKAIVRRTAQLTRGTFPLQRINDFIDVVRGYEDLRKELIVFRRK